MEMLAQGLRPFIEQQMRAKYADRWIYEASDALHNKLDDESALDDPQIQLKLIVGRWQFVFSRVLGRLERSLVGELIETRNSWAHNEPFSFEDAYRALDSVHRLLSAVSAGDEATEVEQLRQELQRQRYDEQARAVVKKAAILPIETGIASGLSAWRDVATPHEDVATGRYNVAEFAADLGQVHRGQATDEYGDPRSFFDRTFITEGLRSLLKLGIERLANTGGEPVIELQTSFGGGKTHSMLALYHLASGAGPSDLPGVEPILKEIGVDRPPRASRAVLVGTQISPGQPHVKEDATTINTLWGELAWQLGGKQGFNLVAEADATRTNPGEALRTLFERYSPCLVLIDEWVAYARQLYGSADLAAGTFETQFTFAQALTEAAYSVPGVLVVVSLPESDIEKGGEGGEIALERLAHVIHRVQSPWRPATMEESFEIVRRRLFQPVSPENFGLRDGVVRAFSEMYGQAQGEFPAHVREGEYRRRMEACYPIHPALFEHLYGQWSTLEKFQRTRGVLRLMAKIIHRLWDSGDRSLLIMPCSVPVADPAVQAELLSYLDDPWSPVIESDVDGPSSLPSRIDNEITGIGRLSGARRVARTIFMGSAPTLRAAHLGIESTQIKLGAVQPGESAAVFGDALRRLTDQATYLYQQQQRYWYSVQPSLNSLARDRADQLSDEEDIDPAITSQLRNERGARGDFVAVHIAEAGVQIPNEPGTRLVILPPEYPHARNGEGRAVAAATEILDSVGSTPRTYKNGLVFLAADKRALKDLREATRNYLAWESIFRESDSLMLDPNQKSVAEQRTNEATTVQSQRLAETYQWVLVSAQKEATSPIEWRELRATGEGTLAVRAARKCVSDEELIVRLGGPRLRFELDKWPLWENDHVELKTLWDYFSRYPYLPRLRDANVLLEAVRDGVGSLAWRQETFAYADSFDKERDRYLGLKAGEHPSVVLEGGSVLVKPERATRQLDEDAAAAGDSTTSDLVEEGVPGPGELPPLPLEKRARRFYGRKTLDSVRLTRDAGDIADNIVRHLQAIDGATVEVTLEVTSDAPGGIPPQTVRTVSENARTLRFDSHGFEEE
jgi:predicted AAA+ superfamily ATPase